MEMNLVYTQLCEILGEKNLKLDEPLQKHTTFKIGGPADIFAEVCDSVLLDKCIRLLKRENVPFFVIGKGSNLLVSDEGYNGVVLKLSGESQKMHLIGKDSIYAGAGVTLSSLALFAMENSLSGLEFASGIPGTVGGGIYMNAGAYGGEIANVLVKSEFYDIKEGKVASLSGEEHKFGYRRSFYLGKEDVILGGYFKLSPVEDKSVISETMKKLNGQRRDKQPLDLPSAGSTFKRPEGHFAAALIEECGLKGYRYGDAAVSDKHSGFVVNLGNATCKEVMFVIKYVQDRVRTLKGVDLEPEVRFVGNI